jgi:hypothetical protein
VLVLQRAVARTVGDEENPLRRLRSAAGGGNHAGDGSQQQSRTK